ncbi:hypothetical protein [Lactobacillus crispatus]|uniref:hypothetical protein n=1 Tax=Lactobacillus crispatus TaxID=47770 RepID=UPI0005DDF18E|nr:hypothetical protein [Lactobacillus crispatus]MCZ3785231.1 hypothetical protein [Lactobacillus crispatus]MCZ3792848.1 hypothetical protein [Lactobacillus crispatus]CPR80966.1 Uncharacterised protein [Chlamydia trachomatis]DAO22668.1 MAG TPA: hypothetical protein [Caudoviricetes sp.]
MRQDGYDILPKAVKEIIQNENSFAILQIPGDTLQAPLTPKNGLFGIECQTATIASLPQEMILAIQFYEQVKKEAANNGLLMQFQALQEMIRE